MSVLLLLFAVAIGVTCLLISLRQAGTVWRFSPMFIAMLVTVYPVSGLVHMLRSDGGWRGFYDLLSSGDSSRMISTSVVVLLGVIVTCIVLLLPSRALDAAPRFKHSPRWYWGSAVAIALALVPFTTYSTITLSSYAAATGSGRVYMLTGGLARYSYVSNWTSWVVSILALWLLARKDGWGPYRRVVVVWFAIAVIATSLLWTGGRSIMVLFCLPLMIAAWPYLRGARWPVIAGAVFFLAFISVRATEARGLTTGADAATWQAALDWQWGKFSMLGFADAFVSAHGPLWGETFWSAMTLVPRAVLEFLGAHVASGTTVSQYTGEYLLGDSSARYIVSGLLPEAYMNFGPIGAVVSASVVAALVRWTDGRMCRAAGPVQVLAYSYLGTLLVFRTLSADSEAIFSYFFLSGFPLLLAAAVSLARRAEVARKQVNRSCTRTPRKFPRRVATYPHYRQAGEGVTIEGQ